MGWFFAGSIDRNVDGRGVQPTRFVSLRRRANILFTLTRCTLGERFHRSRWAGIVSILEPLGIVLFFTLFHSLSPSPPPFGSSNMLFFASGVIPFYLFFHLSSRIRNIDYYRPFPGATRIDHVLARAIGETLTKATIFVLFVIITGFFESAETIPANPFVCLAALATLASLGCAVGLINATIISLIPSWIYIYALLGRIPLLLSGIPFVQDRTPGLMREWITFTPFSHLITWFRSGFYRYYPVETLDLQFSFSVCVVVLFVGILLDDNTREFRSTD